MTSEEPRTVDGVAPGEVRSPVVDSPNHYGSWWRQEPEAYRFMRPDRLRQYTELMARAGVGRIIWWGEPRKVTFVVWADPIPSKHAATKSIIHSTKPEARIYPNLDSTRLKVENNEVVGLMPLSGDWYIEWNS